MTPLVVLVGFLGAGKTTFLKSLLPELAERGLEPHVVINDYQNAKVDSELVRGLAKSTVPISGSCVCCGSRDELLAALESFDHRARRVMVLESNGTTDAEELIELLSLEPGLNRFTLPIQISCIDARRWQKRFWHNGLERDQVRTASYLSISRLDQVDEARARLVRESVSGQVGSVIESVDPPGFADRLAEISNEVGPLPNRLARAESLHEAASEYRPARDAPGHDHHEVGHGHGGEHSAHHFASMQLDLPERIDREALHAFLRDLPDEVIRAKGLVRFEDSPEEFHIFQKVDRFDDVQVLPIGRESRIESPLVVLIGPKISEKSVVASAERAFGIARLDS